MGTPSPPPNEDVEKIQTVEVKKRDNADPDLSTTHPNSQVRFRKTFVKFVILNTINNKILLLNIIPICSYITKIIPILKTLSIIFNLKRSWIKS